MRRLQKIAAPFMFMVLFSLGYAENAVSREMTDLEEAQVRVEEIATQAITLLSDETMTQQDVVAKVRILLEDNMAIDSIGRIVLGRAAYSKMSAEQRVDYANLFREYLLTKYSGLVGSYDGQQIEVTKAVRAGKADAMVYTSILKDGEEPIKVGWRIRTIDGQMRLLDVKIADLSMVQTERDQFQTVYQNSKVDGLLDTLSSLVEKMKKKAMENQATAS